MANKEEAAEQNLPTTNSRRRFLVTAAWSGIATFFLASAAIFVRFFSKGYVRAASKG
jgi:hypothetical protein